MKQKVLYEINSRTVFSFDIGLKPLINEETGKAVIDGNGYAVFKEFIKSINFYHRDLETNSYEWKYSLNMNELGFLRDAINDLDLKIVNDLYY